MTTLLKHCILIVLLGLLTACGVLDYVIPKGVMDYVAPKGNKLSWDGLTVMASTDANLNSPVAVDVVLLRDEATLTLLSTMPASKWFASRSELEKTFPSSLRIRSVEIAPGQTLRMAGGDFSGVRVLGVLIFADYLTPGEHRVRVDQLQGDVLVQLGARAFAVSAPPTK